MTMLQHVLERAHGSRAQWLAVAIMLSAMPATFSERAAAQQASASVGSDAQTDCPPAVISFQTAAGTTGAEVLVGRRDVALRQLHAFRVSDPERVRFRRFGPSSYRGTLSDGCPFAFWWAGSPSAANQGEIRIPAPRELLAQDSSIFVATHAPPPDWIPTFRGYRHIMSSAVYIQGSDYIGLWRRVDGSAGSLVAYYRPEGARVTQLGTAQRNYDGVYPAPSIHQFFFTLLDEPAASELLYIATFEWVQSSPFSRPRRRR